MKNPSPKVSNKLVPKESPLDSFKSMNIDELRESVIKNLRFNNMDVTPEQRQRLNNVCANIIGINPPEEV